MLPDEFLKLSEEERKKIELKKSIAVCTAAGCASCQSRELKDALEKALKASDQSEEYAVRGVGCLGLCTAGPLVSIEKDAVLYQELKPEDADIILSALGKKTAKVHQADLAQPFFKEQKKIVLQNVGRIDPEKIEESIAYGGYTALQKAMTEMTPAEVLEEVTKSGLRGRGGAGFPTGLKWTMLAKASSPEKYVIVNADEGDPGAFMDRSVLEGDPHRVLEGVAIAAYAVGAHQVYLYVRAEYPQAIAHLKTAIRQAERMGFLGNNVLGQNYAIQVEIRLGAGAFVCGEETALIASIEGRRGQPRPRPPFPAASGLWGAPTLINNVETFANIAPIILNGGEWFASIGTEKSKGTKVFALAGKVKNTGLIEVPMGISLRKIIFEIGGGIPDGKKFKAVQTGGPSGGCVPEAHLDSPVDYESLVALGSIMGSGGMIVMDESSCMVDVARYFMDFCRSESCGKCVPCRVGTVQMHTILKKITRGQATLQDLAMLEELCDVVKSTSLCGLGMTAPNPVLSTLRYFRNEYLEHIDQKRCTAGVCKMKSEVEVLA